MTQSATRRQFGLLAAATIAGVMGVGVVPAEARPSKSRKKKPKKKVSHKKAPKRTKAVAPKAPAKTVHAPAKPASLSTKGGTKTSTKEPVFWDDPDQSGNQTHCTVIGDKKTGKC